MGAGSYLRSTKHLCDMLCEGRAYADPRHQFASRQHIPTVAVTAASDDSELHLSHLSGFECSCRVDELAGSATLLDDM